MSPSDGIDLHIPADIVRALRLPTGEVEGELRRDLAVVLYTRGALSVGKAAEFAGLPAASSTSSLGGAGSRASMERTRLLRTSPMPRAIAHASTLIHLAEVHELEKRPAPSGSPLRARLEQRIPSLAAAFDALLDEDGS